MTHALELIRRLEETIGGAFVGKPDVIRLAVVGLLARGHLLIEDVPGVGKTTLAAALARSIGAGFQRIQFTSDVLDEKTILRGAAARGPDAIAPTIAVEEVLALQQDVERVRIEESVLDYVMAIVAATRTSALLALGVSPRGSLALLRAAQAHALADGRDYLVPDDVKGLAVQALAHRVMLKTRNELGSADAESVIRAIVQDLQVPR